MQTNEWIDQPGGSVDRRGNGSRAVVMWLLGVGLVLGLVGAFGPWISHPTAALTVTGTELAELAKFFPQVQSGAVPVRRELFLAPLVTAAVLLGLLVSRPVGPPVYRLRRILLTLAALLLALASLPPYGYVLAVEYRRQLILASSGGAAVLLTLLAHRLPGRAWAGLVALLALAGFAPALVQFVLLRPLVTALYGIPVGLGWGIVACGVGSALQLVGGLAAGLRPLPSFSPLPRRM